MRLWCNARSPISLVEFLSREKKIFFAVSGVCTFHKSRGFVESAKAQNRLWINYLQVFNQSRCKSQFKIHRKKSVPFSTDLGDYLWSWTERIVRVLWILQVRLWLYYRYIEMRVGFEYTCISFKKVKFWYRINEPRRKRKYTAARSGN